DRDDWGHWFGSNNSNPGFQFVLEDRYLGRNPHFAPPSPRVTVVDPAPLLHPLSVTVERFNMPQSANHYTSACGGTIYRDELLGADVAGSYFVCEPSHNLVERQRLTREGLVFRGTQADGPDAHFLRSTDNWFRPVMCRTGPDGALWVVDMYRAVLEHPEWIPDDVERRLDLRAGWDRGHIYRIARRGVPPRPVPKVSELNGPALAAALDSPNGTLRDLVQREITWRSDPPPAPRLEALARTAERPIVRAHALWTLELSRAGIDDKVLLAALDDHEPAVRAQALEIAERHLDRPAVRDAVSTFANRTIFGPAANHHDPDVLLRVAYLLGELPGGKAKSFLGAFIAGESSDPFLVAAALSSLNRDNIAGALAELPRIDTASARSMIQVAVAVGANDALAQAIAAATTPQSGNLDSSQFAILAAAFDAFHHAGKPLAEALPAETKSKLTAALAAARATAADAALPDAQRIAAAELLGVADERDANMTVLAGLLEPQQPAAIQAAAVDALARSADDRVAGVLLAHWDSFSPALAARTLDVLTSREAWLAVLLDRVADGTVQPNQIDATRRQQLLEHRSAELRERAAKLLTAGNADRQKVIDQFAAVLETPGDPGRGRAAFAKRCAVCHRLEGQGFAVGADLAAVGNRSPQALLIAILDPNRAVEDRYVNYVAIDDDGRQYTGVLAAETGESLTLRGQEGKDQVLLRKNLDVLRRTGKSLMPEGLERDMTAADLADVIAYVASTGPAAPNNTGPAGPGSPAPNVATPAIRPAADGTLTLPATAARIVGPTVRLEEKYANLGYWGSADDVASWAIEIPAAGSYAVDIDYACEDATAGHNFLLAAGETELKGKIAGTGSWDRYREARVGRLALTAGSHTLTFRAVDLPPGAFLLDLRAVRLTPVGEKGEQERR
ncbi:MAG TPA: c-type cytochrome, partial [Pirellulales bacterium]|nr:c-type cytochrome [Pirellulales bacterium]